jgi:hypothetical protein
MPASLISTGFGDLGNLSHEQQMAVADDFAKASAGKTDSG